MSFSTRTKETLTSAGTLYYKLINSKKECSWTGHKRPQTNLRMREQGSPPGNTYTGISFVSPREKEKAEDFRNLCSYFKFNNMICIKIAVTIVSMCDYPLP